MKNFNKSHLVSAIAIILAVSAAPAFAQDTTMPPPSPTSPTSNYVMPPPTAPLPRAPQTLGTLTGTDLKQAPPMPGQFPVPPGAAPLLSGPIADPTAPLPTTFSSSMDATEALRPQKVGNVTYITGGIGEEERNVLTQTKKDYNLHVMSADKTGHYVSDTQLVIRDKKGGEVLSAPMGPLFYAQLPVGSYTVEANSAGQMKKENVTIHGKEASNVDFTW